MRIALIEPDLRHAEHVSRLIFAGGHHCRHFPASAGFLSAAQGEVFDLLVTDNWAGDSPAEDVIVRARQVLPALPVIVMLAAPRESQIVGALHAGADDCVDKPARGPEMLARIGALLRRTGIRRPTNRRRDHYGDYTFDPTHLTVSFRGETAILTPKEYRFALLLFVNLSRPVSRAHILENVWARRRDLRSRTLDTHASRVRSKLKLRPEHGYSLRPLYGFGYQLDALPDSDDLPPDRDNKHPGSAT